MRSLVISIIGDDRPGLVSAVSGAVEARGGSWQRSRLARLGGKFAGIVLVEVPAEAVEGLADDLAALANEGIDARLTPAGAEPGPAEGTGEKAQPQPGEAAGSVAWRIHVIGQDRPGIVAEISAALAEHGVGIDEMGTAVGQAPMAGGLLFEVDARLSVPGGTELALVQGRLERLADELMVDLDLSVD